MPKYSEVLSDEEILGMINPTYKKVLLLGCGGCMNESLAFKHNLQIISYGEEKSYPAIEVECQRLKSVLMNNGFLVDTIILPPGSNARCIRDLGSKPFTLPNRIQPDVILVLACPDGLWGISSRIIDVPLLRISKWGGTIFYRYSDDSKERKIEMGKISMFDATT